MSKHRYPASMGTHLEATSKTSGSSKTSKLVFKSMSYWLPPLCLAHLLYGTHELGYDLTHVLLLVYIKDW